MSHKELEKLQKSRKTAKKSFLSNHTRASHLLESDPITSAVLIQAQELVDNFLQKWYVQYDKICSSILEHEIEENLEYQIIEERSDLMTSLSSISARVKKLQIESSATETHPGQLPIQPASQPFKLPKLDLPMYNGDLTKFYFFKNRFESLVHNNKQFDNVTKLHYLSNSRIGKAQPVVSDFQMNSLGYEEAWNHFLSIYENKRALVNAHFTRIRDLEPIKVESGIRELLTQINASVRGLKCCNIQIDDAFSRFLTFLVSYKLDKFTSRDWQNSLSSTDEYPRFEELELFLSFQFLLLRRKKIENTIENRTSRLMTFVPTTILCSNVRSFSR